MAWASIGTRVALKEEQLRNVEMGSSMVAWGAKRLGQGDEMWLLLHLTAWDE